MKRNLTTAAERINYWGLELNSSGELVTGGCSTIELSDIYGTPLHVVNEARLRITAENFLNTMKNMYPGKVSVHYAFKCNPVAGIIKLIKQSGLLAEVMSEFELMLAIRLGYKGDDIVVNGPHKTDRFLSLCINNKVRFINVDSIYELKRINALCNQLKRRTDVLLRINPDFVPSGMNRGSATATRGGSPFGLDMKGGEVNQAVDLVKEMHEINFRGFHIHIGSGIHNTGDYSKALLKLGKLFDDVEKKGCKIEILDVGGGLGVPGSREMTTLELLKYQGLDILPGLNLSKSDTSFDNLAGSVTSTVVNLFRNREMPELIFEPGRCITSSNQMLLLRIHQVKERKGLKKWIITDAGIGTLTMPTYYEYHEVVLCNDVRKKVAEKVTITGPGCFSADIVYRNKPMPDISAGDILAILDSGAYFTSWESTFGFPRPAIISVKNGRHSLLRERESIDHMMSLDII
jgi:diaminopimelate decarboxylase